MDFSIILNPGLDSLKEGLILGYTGERPVPKINPALFVVTNPAKLTPHWNELNRYEMHLMSNTELNALGIAKIRVDDDGVNPQQWTGARNLYLQKEEEHLVELKRRLIG